MSSAWLHTFLDVLGILSAVVIAAVIVRSKVMKESHQELEALVDTRGKRIEDLEKKIELLDDRLHAVEAEMAAVYKIKAEEIAGLVVKKLNGDG